MRVEIPFFPKITKQLCTSAGVTLGELSFTYETEDGEFPLTLDAVRLATEGKASSYNLIDEQGIWDPISKPATVSRSIQICEPKHLFGPMGIVCHNAVLGVAMQVLSLSSNHRFSYPMVSFGRDSVSIDESFSFVLPASFYREKVILRTIFYLKEEGTPEEAESLLANQSGTMLGTLDEIIVFVDGTGSVFPIKYESSPAKPLWRVECNIEDPFVDQFVADTVCIIINQAHKNYPLVKADKGLPNAAFLLDIIASAMQIIIEKTISSVGSLDELRNSDNVTPGSVVDAVRFFLNTFSWDVSSPERLAETIRLDFDRRMTNDK